MNTTAAPFDSHTRARFRLAFLIAVVLAVAVEAVIDPVALQPDGVSYLDLGDAILDGRPWAIVGYFSPLYATWIALAVRIAHASIAHELLVVRAASGVLAVAAALAFEALLTQIFAYVRTAAPETMPRERWWRTFGYGLFLWSLVRNIGPAATTPDVAVMAVVFGATALVVRMATDPAPRARTGALLGIVLGVGYYAKAVVFVNAFIVLGLLSWLVRRTPRAMLAAWVAFLLVASPWITAISLSKGRPTFGDVGRLALVWFQNPVPDLHWQGEDPRYGTPVHTTRRIMREPDVYEFATPFPVSYPPWYDASYWFEGVRWRPDPPAIAAKMSQSLRGTAPHIWMAVAALFGLLAWARSAGPLTALSGPAGALALPAVGAYLLYSPIATFPRYLAGWAVLLYLFVVVACGTWRNGRMMRTTELAMAALLVGFGVQTGRVVVRQARASVDPATWTVRHEDDDDVRAAEAVRAAGIGAGDRAAGIGTIGAFTYWARLARLHTVAEAPGGNPSMFWRTDSATRVRVLEAFQTQGVRVVVADSLPPVIERGWMRVPNSRFAFCIFSAASDDRRCPIPVR